MSGTLVFAAHSHTVVNVNFSWTNGNGGQNSFSGSLTPVHNRISVFSAGYYLTGNVTSSTGGGPGMASGYGYPPPPRAYGEFLAVRGAIGWRSGRASSPFLAACWAWLPVRAGDNATIRGDCFLTGKADAAHVGFVTKQGHGFAPMPTDHLFSFASTQNSDDLNRELLTPYQVVVFLDTRPDSPRRREAFQEYMEKGAALDGLSLLRFSLHSLEIPANWDSYHDEFLAPACMSGTHGGPPRRSFGSKDTQRPATIGLPATSESPNEWYKWSKDLRTIPNIRILASIDPASFPWAPGRRSTDLAQRMLSRRLGKPEIPHDLLQHRP